jgi:hypothetical protein
MSRRTDSAVGPAQQSGRMNAHRETQPHERSDSDQEAPPPAERAETEQVVQPRRADDAVRPHDGPGPTEPELQREPVDTSEVPSEQTPAAQAPGSSPLPEHQADQDE